MHPIGGSPAGQVFTSGESRRVLRPIGRRGSGEAAAPDLNRGPLLIVPLASPWEVVGVVVIAAALGDATAFTAEELGMATGLALQAGIALAIGRTAPGLQRTAMEAEQERITRDFPHRAVQWLFGLGLSLHGLAASLDPEHGADQVLTTVDELDSTIERIRSALLDLHPRRPR